MACRKYQNMLAGYVDRDLSEKENALVESHLSECPDCRALAESLSRSVEVYKSISGTEPLPGVSPYLPERVAARAMEEKRVARPWRMRLGYAFGTLALVGGVFAGYMINDYTSAGPGTDKETRLTFNSEGIGFEIDDDSFILHARDKRGEKGIDLKF